MMVRRRMDGREILPFGLWLKTQAAGRNMTLAEVARRSGLSKGTITLITYNNQPRIQTCRALAGALELPVEDVLAAAGHLVQKEQGFEIPPELTGLVHELNEVRPEVRRRVIAAWRAALEIARTP